MGRAERPRVGRVRAAALLLAAATGLAGCGSTHASGATTTATYRPLEPPSTTTTSTPRADAPPAFPKVGATQRVRAGGKTLSVTVQRLLDPLDGSGATLLPHTRAVGVVAVIRNDGPAPYDSSSTGDFSIVPSSGAATPVFAPTGACVTPLRDWDNEISAGAVRNGCVAFALSTHAQVAAVRFSPHARPTGRATWSVGP